MGNGQAYPLVRSGRHPADSHWTVGWARQDIRSDSSARSLAWFASRSQANTNSWKDLYPRLSDNRSQFYQLRQRQSLLRLCLRAHAPGDSQACRRNKYYRAAQSPGSRRRRHDSFTRLLAVTMVLALLQSHRLLRTNYAIDRTNDSGFYKSGGGSPSHLRRSLCAGSIWFEP